VLQSRGAFVPDSLTLHVGDEVVIEVAGIGRLVNRVG
jgi:hypothetical protein